MCKVIEKFAVKIFFGRTYIITGHDPEIYHLYVYCCMYFKSLNFTVGDGSPVPFFYSIGDCGTGNPSPALWVGVKRSDCRGRVALPVRINGL